MHYLVIYKFLFIDFVFCEKVNLYASRNIIFMHNEIIASARIWPNFPYATPKHVANEIAEKNARVRPTKGQPKFFFCDYVCFGVA